MARRPFRRIDGGVRFDLPTAERHLLAAVAAELRELVVAGDDDLTRLFPPAYADDAEREEEYRSLVGDDLLAKRLEDLDVVERTADAGRIDFADLDRWMHGVNSLRLVLGTRLDVSEESEAPPPEHPNAGAFALYEYFGYLLEVLLREVGPSDFTGGPLD